MNWVVPPSASYELPSALRYAESWVSGVGSQTRVAPVGLRISTRLVVSNMRQGVLEVPCAKAGGARVGYMMPADARPVKRRKLRRSMVETPQGAQGGNC